MFWQSFIEPRIVFSYEFFVFVIGQYLLFFLLFLTFVNTLITFVRFKFLMDF